MTVFIHSILNYIGPGLGGGIITAVLGFITSIFLALFAIIWYPIKRVIGKFRKTVKNEDILN
ncbi:MAG: hypothetical protein JWQ84_1222 [Mucilaginibacter sp.]|jgi:hypothetical protein|nr:hypothetical protein [Mucilaginibacter sp.]MDB5016390.1 hypothetical protein [Mucilaginibacter sp.]